MAQKLAELKNLMIKLNLKNQMFHVKKIGLLSYTEIDILFGKSEDGNYIMRIDDKTEQEIINILDVESVEKQKDSDDKIEIVYMKGGKKYSIVVLVDELIIDQMVKAYKIFFSESMKKLNEINYWFNNNKISIFLKCKIRIIEIIFWKKMDMPLLYSFLEVFNSYNNNLRVIIIQSETK